MRKREREREAETQAEGEAGSMQEAQHGTQSQVSRITPGLKAALNRWATRATLFWFFLITFFSSLLYKENIEWNTYNTQKIG